MLRGRYWHERWRSADADAGGRMMPSNAGSAGTEELPSKTELTVQSVLHRQDLPTALRALEALTRSLEAAQRRGLLGSTVLRFGECALGSIPQEIHSILSSIDAHVDVRPLEPGLTPAAGNNELFRLLDTPLVLVVRADGIVAPDTIAALIARKDPGIGIVEARLLPLEHPKSYDPTTGETSWASSDCILTSSDVLDATGGYDPIELASPFHDIDLSWRARLSGYRVIFEPSARIFVDQRLDPAANPEPAPASGFGTTLSRLLLAHRYALPHVVRDLETELTRSRAEPHLRALREFRRLHTAGALPVRLAEAPSVATFSGEFYAEHRF